MWSCDETSTSKSASTCKNIHRATRANRKAMPYALHLPPGVYRDRPAAAPDAQAH